jgi:hypothetical protein
MSPDERRDTPLDLAALAAEVAELRARVDAHDELHLTSLLETASLVRSHNHLKRVMRSILRERSARLRHEFLKSDLFRSDDDHEDYRPGAGWQA